MEELPNSQFQDQLRAPREAATMALPVGGQQWIDGLIFKCRWRVMNGGGEKNQDHFHYYNCLQKIHSVPDMFFVVFPRLLLAGEGRPFPPSSGVK